MTAPRTPPGQPSVLFVCVKNGASPRWPPASCARSPPRRRPGPHRWSNLGLLVGDVDADLAHRRDGDGVDPVRGHRSGRPHLDPPSREGGEEAGGHLGAAGIVHAHEQQRSYTRTAPAPPVTCKNVLHDQLIQELALEGTHLPRDRRRAEEPTSTSATRGTTAEAEPGGCVSRIRPCTQSGIPIRS